MLETILNDEAPIVVAFSGGKDSVAMVLYLLSAGIAAERIHLHHHEVDGKGPNLFDWPCTTSYCQAFAQAFGLTLLFSYRNGGIYRAIYRNNEPRQDIYYQVEPGGPFQVIKAKPDNVNTRMKFPAVTASLRSRWCSSEVKIDVLRAVITHHPAYQQCLYVLTGERREESAHRQRYEETTYHATHGKRRQVIAWRPLIDWKEKEVWELIQRYRVQPHPAYMLGWSRCSCQLCIFLSPDLWARNALVSPEKIAALHQTEADLGFTLYKGKDIQAMVHSGKAGRSLDVYWVNQALGQFTAPLFTTSWQLPAGAYRNERAGSY